MKEILTQLNKHIQQSRPTYYESLLPSLVGEDILQLEEMYKRKLPDDLKALYQWKNGQDDNNYEAFVNNSMFVPLDIALDTAQEFTSMIGYDFEVENWWNEHWIPLFQNGGGSCICYDMEGTFTGRKGQILEYWNRDNDRNIIASSLKAFLIQVNDGYVRNAFSDEFFEVRCESGFPQKFYVK